MSRGCHNPCSVAGSLRSRCQWGWFLLRPRENLVQAPSSFSALLASLAPWTCRSVTPSLPHLHMASPGNVSISECPVSTRTPVLLDQGLVLQCDLILTKSIHKDPISNKVTLPGTGG